MAGELTYASAGQTVSALHASEPWPLLTTARGLYPSVATLVVTPPVPFRVSVRSRLLGKVKGASGLPPRTAVVRAALVSPFLSSVTITRLTPMSVSGPGTASASRNLPSALSRPA